MKTLLIYLTLFPFLTLQSQGQNTSDRIIFHYLKLSSALSKSDYTKARKQVDLLAPACEKSGLRMLQVPAVAISASQGLAELREKFSPFSDSLHKAIRLGTIMPAEELYLLHCPMAFQDKGADWISDEPRIINPYFGDEMLHCGKVKNKLSAAKK
jgi:hypothetical protein